MAPVPGRTLRVPLLPEYEVGQIDVDDPTGTSAFALVSGATTATGSFSGNDPAHQDADGVHDCASSCVPGEYSAWVSPVTQVIDDEPRQDCFLVAVTPEGDPPERLDDGNPVGPGVDLRHHLRGGVGFGRRRRLLG